MAESCEDAGPQPAEGRWRASCEDDERPPCHRKSAAREGMTRRAEETRREEWRQEEEANGGWMEGGTTEKPRRKTAREVEETRRRKAGRTSRRDESFECGTQIEKLCYASKRLMLASRTRRRKQGGVQSVNNG